MSCEETQALFRLDRACKSVVVFVIPLPLLVPSFIILVSISLSGLKCNCPCGISCPGQSQELLEALLQNLSFIKCSCIIFQTCWTLCIFRFTVEENKDRSKWIVIYINTIVIFLSHQRRVLGLPVLVEVVWLAPYHTSEEKLPHRFSYFQRQYVVSAQLQFPRRKMVRLLIRVCSFLPLLAKNNIKQGESRVRSVQLPDSVQ